MSNILIYKGYYTKVEYNAEENVLLGQIEDINDLICFEGLSVSGIEEEFHNAVDGYLNFCESVGKSPDKIYKGRINLRISSDLHKKLAQLAMYNNESVNQMVERAIEFYTDKLESEEDDAFEIEKDVHHRMPQYQEKDIKVNYHGTHDWR